jgi:DNA polymerase
MAERFTLDFETFYDKDYSLRKMTPVEYILDPRFEVIMLSVKRPGRPVINLSGDKIAQFFKLLDPDDTVIITYNSLFDMCICAWHYNFVPRLMVDAMGMVRAWHGHELRSVALAVAAPHILGRHKGTAVHKMMGLHAADIRAAGWWQQYETYCGDDSELAEGIFEKIMSEGFPASELLVMDHVLRMAVIPQFAVNGAELQIHLQEILNDKANLMAACGLTYDANGKCPELMSNPKFAALLTSLGIDPPMKISPTTGKETFAFSKADKEFTDLEDHPDTNVQALVAARLGHKSTIEETRTQRFISISQLEWPEEYLKHRGLPVGAKLIPMPIRYGAAHTHRLGGDWKLNVQNLPSRGVVNHLKRALMAWLGWKTVNTDSSQIEARIVAWLAGEHELLRQFAANLDPYKIFAAKVFQIDVSLVTTEQRFLGKTSILGLGFGLGWVKFKHQVRVKSLEALKITGKGQELILQDHESLLIVNTYRGTYTGVPKLWRSLNDAISILAGAAGSFSIGPCVFSKGKISLPNGLYLYYHNLRQTTDGWVYDHSGETRRLYGGALLENIVQALARCIVMDAEVRIAARLRAMGMGFVQLALQVHDALAYSVPDAMVAAVKQVMQDEMNRRPAWALDLPLACETKFGPNYGEAK